MKVVLISTYELGRQPFGLASPAAWLREAGHEVVCVDLSIGELPAREVREAGMVAFYLAMHTATRLAIPVIRRVRLLHPEAHLVAYGLYAPLNAEYLRSEGVRTLIGGEFEAALVDAAAGRLTGGFGSLERIAFRTPDRRGLPVLSRYPKLVVDGNRKTAGYTEASRGCKHLCRHCPIVPVYGGSFRVVPVEVVMADIANQVRAGAQHIAFGDPDFLNGPLHARRIVEALHREFPDVTYDVTVKVEHLRQHPEFVPLFAETGCLFVTTAVESLDDEVLAKLDKGHTREDFLAVAEACRQQRLALAPTFIPFTPWTTLESYSDLLSTLAAQELIDAVAPVQLTLRLLVTANSRLLELDDIRDRITHFDPEALIWRWQHSDAAVDELACSVLRIVDEGTRRPATRREIFTGLCRQAGVPLDPLLPARTTIPYMEEPWFC